MRRAQDTTLRYLKILTAGLPVFPRRISTGELQRRLERDNPAYRVSARTMQRDLEKLSGDFPIGSTDEGGRRYWFWIEKNDLTQIPAMSEQTALALRLAESWLAPLLPPSRLSLLRPYFKHARKVLKNTPLNAWQDKVSIVPESQALLPPRIRKDVQETVYEALLQNRQLTVLYQGRGERKAKERLLNPLGLVVRKQIIYLIATAWDYTDPWHYALHRINSASMESAPARTPPGFRLETHIHTERAFSYPASSARLKLKIRVSKALAEHLLECRLAADQKCKAGKDGRSLITATVKDTNELRWWLLGLGAAVEVLAPKSLRAEMQARIGDMNKIYTD